MTAVWCMEHKSTDGECSVCAERHMARALAERYAAVARAKKAEALCVVLAEALDSLLAKANVRDAEAEGALAAYRKMRGDP